MGDHDHSYKLLFAHARMVRELLETFVGGDWLTQVDFDTLERVSDGYITDDLRARADDIVWRMRCGSRHVYLLLEFQSRVECFMAVRVLAYVALLYQDLIRARAVDSDDGLPAVLPVVLHNGSTRWHAGAGHQITVAARSARARTAKQRCSSCCYESGLANCRSPSAHA